MSPIVSMEKSVRCNWHWYQTPAQIRCTHNEKDGWGQMISYLGSDFSMKLTDSSDSDCELWVKLISEIDDFFAVNLKYLWLKLRSFEILGL